VLLYRVYEEVKEFILSCLEFSKDLQLTQTDLDETVRQRPHLSSFSCTISIS
jgi:hypothetical protein